MGTLKTWRKAYGAIKDSTKVGLAHVNSDYADLDVAIVKATNHVECPPKDRHLRKILFATAAVRPRADVAYCIHALARRLAKTHNWTVALKTLIVIHRALREGDPTFREELLNYSQRGRILQLSNFKDDSSPIAWDCSAWVRTYALFLEERLECFKIVKYDIEAERLPRPAQGPEKGYSRTRDLDSEELLEQLPSLQNLLYRLMGCQPEGAAVGNFLIQYALALVLKESFKIYCAVNDGIINLIDKFFEMPRHEAIKALDVYKRAGQQAGDLSDFYEACKGLELARNFQFPVLREPPQSFVATMEEYISEAPRVVSVPTEQPLLQLTYRPEVADEGMHMPEDEAVQLHLDDIVVVEEAAAADDDDAHPPPPPALPSHDTGDLLGLNDDVADPFSLEEKNALALAIVPSGPDGSASVMAFDDPTGWELALVTAPSNDISSVTDRKLGGGLDTLTLNSLYDEGAYRASQQPVYGAPAPNPFGQQQQHHDPFYASNGIAAPQSVQMQQNNNPFGGPPFAAAAAAQHHPNMYHPAQQQQQLMLMGAPSNNNPFGDTTGFGTFPSNNHHGGVQHSTSNPFGGSNVGSLL